jgi:cytochrome c
VTIPAFVLAAILVFLCAPALAQESKGADAQTGQLAFNNACRTCHSMNEGDNRLSPNLHGIIGRKAGSVPGFAYSDAMKHADLVCDPSTLDRFIANPDAVVPSNKMKPFGGIASAEERAKVIAYLKTGGN